MITFNNNYNCLSGAVVGNHHHHNIESSIMDIDQGLDYRHHGMFAGSRNGQMSPTSMSPTGAGGQFVSSAGGANWFSSNGYGQSATAHHNYHHGHHHYHHVPSFQQHQQVLSMMQHQENPATDSPQDQLPIMIATTLSSAANGDNDSNNRSVPSNVPNAWPQHHNNSQHSSGGGSAYQNFDWIPQLSSSNGCAAGSSLSTAAAAAALAGHCQMHHASSEYSHDDSDVCPSPISNRTISPSYLQQPIVRSKSPYEWMKKISFRNEPGSGKTRTKDKYRVVYTDQQRLELEKEFHFAKYITIRRKSELANFLGLSERQVKIWFQNRRAKERKQVKKKQELQCKMEPIMSDGIDQLTIL